ncbi:acyl--CoA ligase [Candidatus Pacearchaeota archaeon]|nr:acyl--CoA ligase [Candidatus Pacearchaeota archaeon]
MKADYSGNTPLNFLFQYADQTPDAPALSFQGDEWTFGHLAKVVRRRAAYMASQGVDKGTKVALYGNEDRDLTTALMATWALGAIAIPMNVTQPPEKLAIIQTIVTPDVAFVDKGYEVNSEKSFLVYPMAGEGEGFTGQVMSEPDDVAIIMFTSGTTGVPKAVPMTSRAIWHNCRETAKRLRVCSEDKLLINSPPYYTSAIIHNFTMFSVGASVVVDRSLLFGGTLVELLNLYECTGFGGVPVHFTRLCGAAEEGLRADTLRFLMNSGEHLPVPVLKKLRTHMPDVEFFCVYGLTEVAGRLCILDSREVDEKAGSVGKPLPGMTITIRDESGQPVGPEEFGQVYVDGICLMSGYMNNPEANSSSMSEWGLATGDYGHLDQDGYLFLKGRSDDIIKVGGEKVSLKMIEDCCLEYDSFEDVLAVPVFDENMGTVPCVYYVLKEGMLYKRKELIKILKAELSSTHLPAFFEEVEEIPRASSGKKIKPVVS